MPRLLGAWPDAGHSLSQTRADVSALKAAPTPVWQKISIGISANGVGGGSAQVWNPKWPKPFKSAPVVSAVSVESWFILAVSNVTATGCTVAVRNTNAGNRPATDAWQDVYAYGELA